MIRKFIATGILRFFNAFFIKEIKGIDNLPDNGFIAVANHSSYLDIPAMAVATFYGKNKLIRFLAKRQLITDFYFRIAYFLAVCDENRPVVIDRERPKDDWISEASKSIGKGHIIGIFPEGTRSVTGKMQKAKTGAVRLALKSEAPIVPMGIIGSADLMPKGKSVPRFRKSIVVSVGNPLYFKEYYGGSITKKTLEKLTTATMEEVAKLSGQRYKP